MFKEAMVLQFQNFFLGLLGYCLTMLLGVLVGGLIVYIPGIEETVKLYTDIHIAAIFAFLMVIVKIIKG